MVCECVNYSFITGNDNRGDIGQVYYFNGVWWLGKPEFGGYHLHKMVAYNEQTTDDLTTYLGNVIEVIGNTHENPELLEAKS
jgi:hypothetical protein